MFDHLTPEDFNRETSAVREKPHADGVRRLGLHTGPAGFHVHVEDLLKFCRERSDADEDFVPFAVLHGSDFQRYFEGEDDEVPMDFARRLNREAKQMNASWSFVAMVAPARAVSPDDEPPTPIDTDDLNAIQDALMTGHLDLCVCWSASFQEADVRLNRGGIMYLDDDGAVTNEVEGPLNPETDPFSGVLG